MSVLGTTKHSSCNQCIDTWQYSCIIVYSKLLSVQLEFRAVVLYAQSVFYAVQCCLRSRCFTQYSIANTTEVVRSTICMCNWREFWGVQYCTTGVLGSSVLYHGSSGEFSIVFCWSEPHFLVSLPSFWYLFMFQHAEQGQFLPVPILAYVH